MAVQIVACHRPSAVTPFLTRMPASKGRTTGAIAQCQLQRAGQAEIADVSVCLLPFKSCGESSKTGAKAWDLATVCHLAKYLMPQGRCTYRMG